jgi:hypothetical protein
MKFSEEELRVLACMRSVCQTGRRQILWHAQQVAKLEKLLSKDEEDGAVKKQCGNFEI